MRFLMSFILILLLSGCASKREVINISLPCEVKTRLRPSPKKDDLMDSLREIFIYLEGLESDLKFCKGELNGR